MSDQAVSRRRVHSPMRKTFGGGGRQHFHTEALLLLLVPEMPALWFGIPSRKFNEWMLTC